jgi:hypothetical protein
MPLFLLELNNTAILTVRFVQLCLLYQHQHYAVKEKQAHRIPEGRGSQILK